MKLGATMEALEWHDQDFVYFVKILLQNKEKKWKTFIRYGENIIIMCDLPDCVFSDPTRASPPTPLPPTEFTSLLESPNDRKSV